MPAPIVPHDPIDPSDPSGSLGSPIVIRPGGWPCCCPSGGLTDACHGRFCDCFIPAYPLGTSEDATGILYARILHVVYTPGSGITCPAAEWDPNICELSVCERVEDTVTQIQAGLGSAVPPVVGYHLEGGHNYAINGGFVIAPYRATEDAPCQLAIYVRGSLTACAEELPDTIGSSDAPTILLDPGDCDYFQFEGTYVLPLAGVSPSFSPSSGSVTIQVSRTPCP